MAAPSPGLALGLRQAFSTCHIHLLGGIIIYGGGHPGHCRRPGSTPCFYPINASNSPLPVMTTKNVSRCPLSPGEQNQPGVENHAQGNYLQQMSPPVRVLQQRRLHPQHVALTQLGTEERAGLRATHPHGDRQHVRLNPHGTRATKAWAPSARQRNHSTGNTGSAFFCPWCRGGN